MNGIHLNLKRDQTLIEALNEFTDQKLNTETIQTIRFRSLPDVLHISLSLNDSNESKHKLVKFHLDERIDLTHLLINSSSKEALAKYRLLMVSMYKYCIETNTIVSTYEFVCFNSKWFELTQNCLRLTKFDSISNLLIQKEFHANLLVFVKDTIQDESLFN